MRINLRIAYFLHFFILRKKKCENWYFRSISYPSYRFHSFSLASLGTHVSLFLLPALFVTLPRFSPFFRKREWDKLVNLYANGFGLEGR